MKKWAKEEAKAMKEAQKFARKLKKRQEAAVAPNVPSVPFERPAPSPSPKARQEEGIFESSEGLNPRKAFQVRCPQCGKTLAVKETSPYHRCPACDKVFKLKKYETYVLKD